MLLRIGRGYDYKVETLGQNGFGFNAINEKKETYETNTTLDLILSCACTGQKMTFSIKDFFSKCGQIRKNLQICSHLLKKPIMENFIFCAVLGS